MFDLLGRYRQGRAIRVRVPIELRDWSGGGGKWSGVEPEHANAGGSSLVANCMNNGRRCSCRRSIMQGHDRVNQSGGRTSRVRSG